MLLFPPRQANPTEPSPGLPGPTAKKRGGARRLSPHTWVHFHSPILVVLLLAGQAVQADRPPNPFTVAGALDSARGPTLVRFQFTVPPDHVIYADRLKFEDADGEPLEPTRLPAPVVFLDSVSGHEKRGYTNSFAAELKIERALPWQVLVKFQGCSNAACYFPEKKLFEVSQAGVALVAPAIASGAAPSPEPKDKGWQAELARFKVTARETGYLKKSSFLALLDKCRSGGAQPDDPLERFKRLGLPATLGLILLGGAGLNLTPCVLPLIPVNLALMGATARGRSRKRGFALGSTYGAGMALAYGVLGLVVVLTGARFGALNSSMWFNVIIAAVFLGLAVAMFDVFHIDFTRFQNGLGAPRAEQRGQLPFVFTLGAMTALLAGACVAPVVISVLLMSAKMFTAGHAAGLLLPLLLGLGMASLWPFAGAGLAYIPKPGKWMVWVKRGFGVMILAMAAYYGHIAWNLAAAKQGATSLAGASGGRPAASAVANDALGQALQQGRQQGRPVFVDFWASWCKNCVAMDETSFKAAEVQERLKDFIVVKYVADAPGEPATKEVLDQFGVLGLPTYVVLQPKD
jgi:thioredoxin:protein disulfide reductase